MRPAQRHFVAELPLVPRDRERLFLDREGRRQVLFGEGDYNQRGAVHCDCHGRQTLTRPPSAVNGSPAGVEPVGH